MSPANRYIQHTCGAQHAPILELNDKNVSEIKREIQSIRKQKCVKCCAAPRAHLLCVRILFAPLCAHFNLSDYIKYKIKHCMQSKKKQLNVTVKWLYMDGSQNQIKLLFLLYKKKARNVHILYILNYSKSNLNLKNKHFIEHNVRSIRIH